MKGEPTRLPGLIDSDVGLIHVSSIDKWSPALQIRTVLLSVQALLSAPNPDDPLATDVAKHYKVSYLLYVSLGCLERSLPLSGRSRWSESDESAVDSCACAVTPQCTFASPAYSYIAHFDVQKRSFPYRGKGNC